MSTTILKHKNMGMAPTPDMSAPLIKSFLFHGIVVAIIIVGLPFTKKDPPDIFAAPMTVELVEEADIDQTNKPPVQSKVKPPENTAQTPPSPHKQMPQVTAKTPPKPVAPEKPAPPEPVTAPPEDTKISEANDKPAPKPSSKPQKPKQQVKQANEAEKQKEFKSLLRNLMPAEPEQQTQDKADDKPDKTTPEESPLAQFSQKMTMSEHAALRRQLSQCWSLLAGARYAEDLIVDIRLFMNPDRTIRDATVVNELRYAGDKFYRAAADAAMRAVRNPRCNPLDLPPNKYEQWKTIVVTFDPRKVL